MKIVCVIHSLNGGGAERVLAKLASGLAEREHEVILITLDDGSLARHQPSNRVQQVHLNVLGGSRLVPRRVWRLLRRMFSVRAELQRQHADVVLSFCDRTNVLTLIAAGGLSSPVVVAERSEPAKQQLGGLGERLRDRAYRKAAAIVALSRPAADYLGKRFAARVHVIPSAVDRPPRDRDRSKAMKTKRLLAVGRLEHEKGFDRLLDAFAKVHSQFPDWSLRILGEGSRRDELQTQAHRLGIATAIEFAGWVQPVWDELAEATMFVLPSRYEGFPSALLEAMAMGVPSVAVDCPSGPRAIIGEATGSEATGSEAAGSEAAGSEAAALLVGNNVEALAQGMIEMISDPEHRERIGQQGRSVCETFNWDAMINAYEQVLINAAEGSVS